MRYPSRIVTARAIERPRALERNQVWWHRIFTGADVVIPKSALRDYFQEKRSGVLRFQGSERSWNRATVEDGAFDAFFLDRFASSSPIVRQQIRTWRSWVVAQASPNKQLANLLEATRHVYLIPSPPWGTAAVYTGLCKLLATSRASFQIDGQGIFDGDDKRCLIREYHMFGPKRTWWQSKDT